MSDLFKRVSMMTSGYDRTEVDDFFQRAQQAYESGAAVAADEVRRVTFTRRRGGYRDTEVDAALDRLEEALDRKQRSRFVEVQGQKAWMDQVSKKATTLYDRLTRPAGKKFAPAKNGSYAYTPREVDALCDKLVAFFNDNVPLASRDVRHATFTMVKGVKGYDTVSVDAFFMRAVEVLSAIE